MGLFLQVLGAIFLLILLYVGFRLLLLAGKVTLILYGIKKLIAQGGQPTSPATIRLIPVAGASWEVADAQALAAPLASLNYQEVGFFDLDILGGVRLEAWVQPDLGLYSVIYSSPQAGIWSDVVTKYEDGTSLTYSNSPHGGQLRQREGRENVYFRGLGSEELHQRMLAERPDRPTRHLSAADFAPDFERAYTEEMAWRSDPTNFDPEAVGPAAALASVMSGKFNPDQIRQVRHSMVRKMYEVVAQSLRSKYHAEAALPEAEWAKIEPRLVFVWDTMNVESLQAVLREWSGTPEYDRLDNFLDDHQEADDDDGSGHVRRSFAELNAGVAANRRLTKVGEIPLDLGDDSAPMADVYLRTELTTELA